MARTKVRLHVGKDGCCGRLQDVGSVPYSVHTHIHMYAHRHFENDMVGPAVKLDRQASYDRLQQNQQG